MYRVMIADDEPVVRKALQVLTNWESIDCQIVYVASDGQEVIDNIENVNPDIIVTDIKMPVVDGLSIARYIQEKALPIKVILLTAYADFSYAKTALQFGVVDYVTKDGAFDGLMKALGSAKQKLEKERKSVQMQSQPALIENFFKSLIDGSVYDREEIATKAKQYNVILNNYILLAFSFHVDANLDREKKKRINDSLLNFFGMLFQHQKIYIVSVKRNLLCVLLDDIGDGDILSVQNCCDETIDIVRNFMKLNVHIGGSSITKELQDLRKAYHEAELAIGQSFYSLDYQPCFYEPHIEKHSQGLRESQQYSDELSHYIQKGDKDTALNSLHKLFCIQSENRIAVETVKSNGVYIVNCCQRYLMEYETTVEEIMKLEKDFSQLIYDCFQMEEYRGIMTELIQETADFVAQSVNRKNVFVHECERMIKENVQGCINVSEIASRLGVSGSYLSRVYKEKTGHTVIHAITQAKLEKAQELLKNTDMKIYEIADFLGFDNITYFSHFFKKHMRVSPIEYKKNYATE